MAVKSKRKGSEECALDMTPMIDVVFQLIIFFVVTLKAASDMNKDIILEYGVNGPKFEEKEIPPLIIEVAQNGRISINNATLTPAMLASILNQRVERLGTNFPLLIRADKRTHHEKVREVMNVCTARGLWKISFVALIEKKGK